MRKTAIYFSGLIILAAGIFLLNAQDNVQSAGNGRPAAQAGAVEESENGAAEKSPASAVKTSPAASTQNLSAEESTTVVAVESNIATGQPQAEIKTDQPKVDVPAGSEKVSTGEKTPGFEIDRGKGPAKESAPETGGTSEAVKATTAEEKQIAADEKQIVAGEKQAAAVEKPAVAPKPARRGLFWGLFGAGKKQKPDSEKAPESVQPSAAGEAAGVMGKKSLTPEEFLAAQEEVRRQAKEIEGLKKLDQAYQEMGRNEFENALKRFNEALSAMPVRPHTVETRQKAMMSEAECEYRLALKNYREGKINEAREGIRRALEYFPAHRASARLNERIKQDELRRAQMEAQPVPLKKSPAYQDKQKKIKADLQRGYEYMAIKEYDNAENEFRNVLVDDKLNSDASANLKKIAEKRFNLETDEFQRMKAEMLAQIRDTWIPPIKKVVTGPRGETGETIITSQARRRLVEKLNSIIIPEINFRDANIVDVMTYLHQQSITGDRDSIPGEKGVNFILNLKRPGQASAEPAAPRAESADLFAAEDAKPAAGVAGEGGSIPKITLNVRNISLMEILKYIAEFSGLKYRIEERVVIIHPADVAYGELETRTYKVQPSIVETFMGGGVAAPAAESDKLELGASGTLKAERQDMKKFFTDAGIPFPVGTSLMYIPNQTLLIVKNTSENLENFERLLNKLNVPPVQVEIESRFVEIGQQDLEEIGLEWLLTDNWKLAEKQSGLPPSMRERLQMNKNAFTKGLRELNVAGGQAGAAAGGNMGSIVSISSILTNPELTVILHALEQKDGVNLLSAPKVTTKSGASAEIKVIEELIYPTEYQQQAQSIGTTTSGNQSLVQIVVTPSAFETRDLGVILQVTPTVGPDNETIDLAMLPKVVELSRWIDYGSDVPTGDPARTQHLTLLQPVFHCREITTSISIWDGQTVVMGGLITEGQQNTEDKIPLLGDIPLLGYLFRSKTSKSIKKNLLIFVTANLVDPAGNKIKKEIVASLSSGAAVSSATP